MSLFNASDRISPDCDRQAMVVRLTPLLYVATLFVSALLLFSIQPMFAKMVLPKLGGAPAVWSVAMVFFQTVLLSGYAYAHLLNRVLPPRWAAVFHLALLGATATMLPIAIAPGWGVPPSDGTALWLFGLFAVSIGLPFFTLSASAPLLQSWFAGSGHSRAGNPYVLYAASNLGSFAALFAYPVVIEPFLTLKTQAAAWSIGFALLAMLLSLVAVLTSRAKPVAAKVEVSDDMRASTGERMRWIALAAVPSGLVIAVTAYLTTDIAAAPFLWVVPLAIYLLTFVAVFRERPWIAHANVVRFVPFAVAPLAVSLIGGEKVFWLTTIALNLVVFALLTLMCHGELYARRPSPRRLTEFYLCTSLGGVIGGAFAGLVAPQIFNGNYEYPILIALALLCAPGIFTGGVRKALTGALPWLAISAALALVWYVTRYQPPATLELAFQVLLALLAAATLFQRQRPMRFVGLVILSFAVTALWRPGIAPIETARSFFGVHKVAEINGGSARLLYHGTTIHGAQRLRNDDGTPVTGPLLPQTYYYPGGPYAEAIGAARAARGSLDHVAVVGLGTGTLACHRKGRERWTFFEIDPEVIRIARDPRRFEFLSKCAPDAPIVAGDARLTLEASTDRYDLIVLDAFSSDAIPVHLLTREAVAGYLSKLTPHGVIVVHISNRYFDLAPVVGNVAQSLGLVAYLREDTSAGDLLTTMKANARLVVLARDAAATGSVAASWTPLQPDRSSALWTDDYSNILGVMLHKKFGG
ncbi:fused MFS/spermidine synthase [Bradyrhizobium sp. AUGA SZCCT0182]|uniref:fused MFS/spermidine synthase n=1 Tax=Bradyrhizobium sp. AUGA SZCCT0182 TaxID=2807667 RepID=UPI001BABD54B|nr:fused MFS/spermidine synthase [Bradyrhizobium sp. AUGA SZCCT0182]MBR1230951.1 fused MFS/spermidine synthase [Bradyrhizobium sp. AUGA SZCCT0182]